MLPEPSTSSWLNLNEAACYLGVHFTTLRRWADSGAMPCLRTPGGHRRFARQDLDAFVGQRRNTHVQLPANGLTAQVVDHTRTEIQTRAAVAEQWYAHFSDEWRAYFRMTGQRFMGLLMQFVTRHKGGEVFLDEGLRLAEEYGQSCWHAGLSVGDTVQAFLFFRRSVSYSIYGAQTVAGPVDADSRRLFERMSQFMDRTLIATVEGYCKAQNLLATPINER